MKLALAFAVIASPAIAQSPSCFPFQEVERNLSEQYGEKALFVGLDPRGTLLSIFLNAESGTWTAYAINPAGLACFVAKGEAGAFLPPEANGVDG